MYVSLSILRVMAASVFRSAQPKLVVDISHCTLTILMQQIFVFKTFAILFSKGVMNVFLWDLKYSLCNNNLILVSEGYHRYLALYLTSSVRFYFVSVFLFFKTHIWVFLDHVGRWNFVWKYVLISIHSTTKEAWLSGVTLKFFISGVSSRILMLYK